MTDPVTTLDMTSRKALLQYLVRMGSFTSSHKILNDDTEDNDVEFPEVSSWEELHERCQKELLYHPPRLFRTFQTINPDPIEDFLPNQRRLRVMQWNVLSQALAIGSDNFVACPIEALSWWTRRWRILEEIVSARPDILCLQEVDHYQFFKKSLGSLGFRGTFFPKPDSPCYYIAGNNGPDGCAVFFDQSKYDLIDSKTRSLEVWGYQSNQVAVLCNLRRRQDNFEFSVASTHLKARQGALLSTMRLEQGKDLLDFIRFSCGNRPVILTGDFNAEPSEPVYWAVTKNESMPLDSAYRYQNNRVSEPPYTTWKIREDGECCQTLDYIFFNKNFFQVENLLNLPSADDIGEGRVPSFRYPSDHFSLVTDFRFTPAKDVISSSHCV